MYEIFEHTADVGIRARAGSLAELFADAARGLFSLIVVDPETVGTDVRRAFDIGAPDLSYLLFDWLSELLFEFDTRRTLLADFEVTVGDGQLHGLARGEAFDPARHALDHEVKAITYHGLNVRRRDGRWEATVIVDI